MAGPLDTRVGSLNGFNGEHGLILDGDTLADIEPAQFFGGLPAEDNVFLLPRRRAVLGQRAFWHEQFRAEIGRRSEMNPFTRKLVYDRTQQGIVTTIPLPCQQVGHKHANRPQVGP